MIWIISFGVLSLHAQSFNANLLSHTNGMPGNEYSDVWGYVDNTGKEYAIIGSHQAINIYDVTDCAHPVLILAYNDGANAIWRDFKTYRNYLYAVCDHTSSKPCYEGLEIINLDNYSYSQNTSDFTSAHNIYVDTTNARLYVVGSNATGGALTIYTLDTEIVNGTTYQGTPGNPVLLRKMLTSYIHDIYVKNNIAYASHGYNGYYVWDVSDPSNIIQLISIDDLPGYNHSSWVTDDGQYAFVAEELPRGRPINIYQLTIDGANSSAISMGNFKEPLEAPTDLDCRPHNPFVKGDTLFISYYEDGTQVFDISNPLQPKRIAYLDTYLNQNGIGYYNSAHDWKGHWGVYPFLPSGCMIAADITQGMYTFKLDIPTENPTGFDELVENLESDFDISTSGKGLVLRTPSGYCYRLVIDALGNLTTERINCHVFNQVDAKIVHSDLSFSNQSFGLILKDANSNCFRTKVDNNGNLYKESVSCSSGVKNTINNGDVFIETYTKGIILRNNRNKCYRITVNDSGTIISTELTSCP